MNILTAQYQEPNMVAQLQYVPVENVESISHEMDVLQQPKKRINCNPCWFEYKPTISSCLGWKNAGSEKKKTLQQGNSEKKMDHSPHIWTAQIDFKKLISLL